MPNWNDPKSIRDWLDENKKRREALGTVNGVPIQGPLPRPQPMIGPQPRPVQPLPTPTPIIQQPGLPTVQMQGAPRPQNNTGIRTSAPASPTVAMGPQPLQQRPSSYLPQTQSGAYSYNPVPRGSITDGSWKPADAWNWMAEGINNTPAMKYTQGRVEDRKADGDQWYDAILNGVEYAFDTPGRILKTQPLIPNMAQVFQNGTKKGEDWFSVADVSSALGSFYNKAYDLAVKNGPNFFNPLNPEGLNATFLDPKNNLMSHVAEEVQRSVDFKKSILALPPQQRAVAEMVIANNYTGLNAMQDSYKAFEEKATMPAVWRQQAQELAAKAQAGGLPDQVATNMMRQASVLWNRAQEIEAKSYSQIIDEHQNFRSELVMGVLFDPTDFIVIGAVQAIGMTHEAITAANMARKMNISPEAAIKAMEAAVADASPLVSRVLGGGNVFDTKSAWSKINPFARTSETLARMDTNELFKAAVPLFAGIHGGARVDAVKVLSDWLGTAGQKIVQGMPIGSMQNLADNAGNVRFGPGLLGNEDVIKRFPILKIVEKQLMEMGSLKGDGVFRVDEFLSEFRRITQQGADLYYGVATNTLKKAVPAVGKKAAKEAITYKTGMTTADKIAIPSNLMRAIMSDMWLNSRPAHWIRNAASASTQLLAKGLYTWRSIEDIANNYARRLGIPGDEALNLMPTLRTTDAMGGVPSIAENTENFTRKFWPNNNPYAGLMEWGAQRWGGTQQLLKNIPVAEQSLYLTGLDRGMERAFRQYWSMAISQQIAPLFESMGVAPDLTKKFIGEIIDAGNGGAGKKEIIDSFRQTVEKSTITTTLTDLGVPEELITDAKVRQELAQVFRALTPMNLADSEATIRGLFARLRLHPGAVLNDAAPMPEDILGSKDTIVADVASYIDDMERTAKAGGIDPQSTKAFMQVMAKDMTTVQSEGMKNMLADFARATDPTAAGSVMVETFSALVERQQVLRQMMDAASQRAIKASMGATPEVRKAAWAAKWVENQQLIKTYLEDIKGLFASGRTSLMSGAPTNPAFNRKAWDDLIDRYVNYDPAAIEATRGIVGQGPTDNITKRVIDANRAYLDEAMTTLLLTSQWIAKQGNPASTEDALNHIQDAWAAINHIGAQTAAVVAIKRDTMLPLQAADFYTQSADEWKRAFERMVTYVHAYRRDALFTHLSHSAPNRLMWKGADGAVYRLEGMMTDGRYLVKNTQTNAETVMNASGPQPAVDPDIMKFAGDPAKFKASDEVVPSYIVDSYNKVLNNTEEQIDEIIAQVDGVPVTTVTEESLQATAKQGGTAKKNAQWAGVESITPPTFKVQEVEPPPAAPFKFPGEEGYTGPASVPTPPVAPKVDMNGVALTTPIQRTELRKAASASGIATAAKSGNPTDKHLLGSIKKRLGWSYTSLDNIPQNRLPAIYEMLTKRTEETAGAAAKLGVPTPPTNVAGDVPLPSVTEVTAPAAKVTTIPDWARVVRLDDPNATDEQKIKRLFEMATKNEPFGMPDVEDAAWMSLGKSGAIKTLEDAKRYYYQWKALPVEKQSGKGLLEWSRTAKDAAPAAKVENIVPTADPTTPASGDVVSLLPPGMLPASDTAKWGQPEELKFLINKNELNINDAYLKLRKSIAQNKAGVKEASMGHYAAQTLKTLDQVEQRILKALPEMAAGTVNNLTPAQRLALFDAVAGKVAPAYDNVLAAASNAGERLANAAMLNFQDRRGTDWILALLFPYHYFWSRTAKNWAAQVLEKPAFLDVWYTTERQIENENRAKDLPTRLQGTLPNPLKEMTGAEWMPDRIGNPFRWMLPFSMYMANEFIDPEDAQSEGEKWMMRMQQYTPGMFPHIRFAIDTFLDNTSPLPDGRKRVGEFELGGNVPLWRIAGYTSQAMGGMTANQLNAGDKFDPYRVARWASNNSVPVDGKKPKFTPEVAQYVQQMAINQRDGVPLEQGIPPNFVTAVTAAYQEGLKATAWERLASTAGSFFTGNAGYYYSPEEAKLRATSQEYNQAGFSPTNPVGSQTAKNTIIDQDPFITTGWSKSMAIPGETGTMPAQSANTGMLYDTRSNLYAEKKAAEDAAIRAALNANPALKVSEMNKIRAAAGAPFQEQIDALKKEIDGASAGTVPPSLMDVGPDTVPTGTPVQMMTPQNAPRELKDAMNPQEQQSVAIGNAFDNAKALPGRPADGAPDAEWNNYKAMQQAYVVEQLSDTKMTEAEILKLFDESSNWNRGPAELEVRQNAEERVGATRGAVVSQFGEEAGSVWDAYYALPKGDARSQFAAENPQIKVYNFAAYNPNEYAQASEMFGKDAIMAWAATPPWGESAEAAAKREAYFDANPVVWFVDAWVDGRPREYDPESKPETRNFGADWKEAETLYGEDIWGKVIQWRGADKAGRREIRSADPALDQFIDWWYGLMPQTTTRGGFVSGGSRGGWGGGGGGGRGGGYNPYAGQRPPTIYAESMNKDLWYGPRGDTWRPDRYDDSWRYAGQDIRPEPIKKWKKGA